MFNEQMSKIKNLIVRNPDGKNNKKKIENLAVFLIILIITLIVINVILSNNDEKEENVDSAYKELAKETTSISKTNSYDELEKRIENILETMAGVRQSKCSCYLFTNI